MTDAFYIIKVRGAQAAADADSFHQVERVIDKIGASWAMITRKKRRRLSFSVAPFYSLEYNLAPTKLSFSPDHESSKC
jgi:hypothetical protein